MPNHVTNEVSAPEHVIQAILDENGEIDFERILPRPAIYERFGAGIACIDGELVALGVYAKEKTNYKVVFGKSIIGREQLQSLANEDGKPLEEHEVRKLVKAAEPFIIESLNAFHDTGNAKIHTDELVLQALCLSQTGFTDPIAWSYENWGTKWNGYESEEFSPTLIRFCTAWSCPYPLLVALSKKFPNDEIEVKYADEDIGNNCGYFTLINGETVVFCNDDDEVEKDWDDFASNLIYGISYEELMAED